MNKKEQTHKKIIKSAYTLFSEKGFESTNVIDICKKSGVAKGTFYYHFEQKDDILFYFLEKDLKDFFNSLFKIKKNTQLGADKKLENICKALFAPNASLDSINLFFKKRSLPDRYQSRLAKSHRKYLNTLITEIILEGTVEKLFQVLNPGVSAEVITLGLSEYMKVHYLEFSDQSIYQNTMKAFSEIINRTLSINTISLL